MTSRRAFLSRLGSSGSLDSGRTHHRRPGADGQGGRAGSWPVCSRTRRRRRLLARGATRLHARPHGHQPEQRRRLPQPSRRPRGLQALPRPRQPGARVQHVAGAGAQPGAGARRTGTRCGLRRRGARHHAQRQRGPPDRAARHRPEAGRRGRHDDAGLRAHARHVGAARASRRHHADQDLVPGAAALDGRPDAAPRARADPADEGAALLPHHQPDGANLPGGGHLQNGPGSRHPDHRRRRARVRALPVRHPRPGVRLLRHEPAQVAARADRDRLPVRATRADSRRCGRSRPPPRARRATSASSRRSAPTRPRTTTRSPKPASFTRRSAASGRSRGCATCAIAGCAAWPTTPRRGSSRASTLPRAAPSATCPRPASTPPGSPRTSTPSTASSSRPSSTPSSRACA